MKKIFFPIVKNGFVLVTLAFMFLAGFSSCKKSSSNTGTDIPTDATKFNALMDAGFKSLLQTATFDASNTSYVYTSPKGTAVFIDGSCLRKNGNAVTGTVKLEFFEAYEFSDMIIANKAVMGLNSSGKLEPLITGGQYYINVSQDGVNLTTNCSVSIETSANHTGGYDSEMVGWTGYFDKGNLLWKEDPQVAINGAKGEVGSFYNIEIPGFGWFNCDKFMGDSRPKTDLNVTVPSSYVDASYVYVIIKGEPYTMGLASYGQWPIGAELYLIFVTESSGNYKWEMKEITVQNNMSIAFEVKKTTIGNLSQFAAFLATLQ